MNTNNSGGFEFARSKLRESYLVLGLEKKAEHGGGEFDGKVRVGYVNETMIIGPASSTEYLTIHSDTKKGSPLSLVNLSLDENGILGFCLDARQNYQFHQRGSTLPDITTGVTAPIDYQLMDLDEINASKIISWGVKRNCY